jgi:hypothetical protein
MSNEKAEHTAQGGRPAFSFVLVPLGEIYFPIRNILVPHAGHTPWVAGLPFFMVMALAFFISFLDLHFIQYACISFTSFLTTNNRTLPQ